MSQEMNPYAAPRASIVSAPDLSTIEWDGKALKVPKDFVFPPLCLKTGVKTGLMPQQKRRLTHHSPYLALLILINLFVYLIVALIVRKKGMIHFNLSAEAARKRKNTLLLNWGLFLGGIAAIWVGGDSKIPMLMGVGGIAILVSIILALVAGRFLWAKKIDDTHIWVCGVPDDVARSVVTMYREY